MENILACVSQEIRLKVKLYFFDMRNQCLDGHFKIFQVKSVSTSNN